MTIEQLIKQKIEQEMKPSLLKLENESYKHKGHAGDNGTGQTHFKLKIVSDDFLNLSRVQRQQKIYSILNPLFDQGLHALSLDLRTNKEEGC